MVVHDESLPRGFWKLGRVQSVLVGHDGQARVATVRLMRKDGQSAITLNRPLQRLYPLEIKYEPPGTYIRDQSNPKATLILRQHLKMPPFQVFKITPSDPGVLLP